MRAALQPACEPRGLVCPKCGCGHFRVIYTRRAYGGIIRRRRECRHCERRITTWERSLASAAPPADDASANSTHP